MSRIARSARGCLGLASLLAALSVWPQVTAACGQEWTDIGSPQWEHLCVHRLRAAPDVLLSGAPASGSIPNTGGLWRWEGDTLWTRLAFNEHTVRTIKEFDNQPGVLFATAGHGVFQSTDQGMTWDTVVMRGTYPAGAWDFAISPHDPNQWVAAFNSADGEGYMKVSGDAGATWNLFWPRYWVAELTFSQVDPDVMYYQCSSILRRVHWPDSSSSNVYTLPHGEPFYRLRRHPSEPWLYLLGQNSLTRWDEVTHDTLRLVFADSIDWALTMEVDTSAGLVVGTSDGLYRVDYDLTVMTSEADPLPPPSEGADIFLVSTDRWVVQRRSPDGPLHLYCRSPQAGVGDGVRGVSGRVGLQIYPNPARDWISLTLGQPGRVELFNLLGQRVSDVLVPASSPAYRLSLDKLSSGTYYVLFSPTHANAPAISVGRLGILK